MKEQKIRTGHQKGLAAEARAAFYLRLKGYRVLARRFRTPLGEIDIIARRGRTVVFVEVKLRRDLATAAEAIGMENQRRVRAAAALYLQKHPEYTGHDMRFDAMIFSQDFWPLHEKDSF